MRIPDILINGLIVLCTFGIVISYFRKDGQWSLQNGRLALRFFTTLSNLLCAVSALCVLCTLRPSGIPYGVWLLKYLGSAAVTVTFLTVMFFLGPALGYKELLSRDGFYMHLSGPLLALFSFCFLERSYTMTFSRSLLALLPVVLYGLVYFVKVVIRKDWEDFYGYNKNGKWPISAAAMFVGAFLIGLLFLFLCKLGT